MQDQLVGSDRVTTPKVLSIQSHVVHGYVGNKAATFPLQYRGWDVDVLNTVQLSNHPGYGKFTGFRSNAKDICDILKYGLFGELDMNYNALLTGYIPCTETLESVGQILGEICEKKPQLKWVLDPVLGDNGRLYVSENNVPVYKNILKSNRIFVVTPNQFEMETLSGVKIDSVDSLKKSFLKFHERYPKVEKIVITSMELSLRHKKPDFLVCACFDTSSQPKQAFYFEVPKLNAHFSGSGDLFTALLLDLLTQPTVSRHPSLPQAVGRVLSLVDDVLQKTLQLSFPYGDQVNHKPSIINDLKLINCADLLERNAESYHVSKFTITAVELS